MQLRNAPVQAEDDSATPARPPLYVAQLLTKSNGSSKIRRVLIANRGEIACRIIQTCRKLNLISIAVFVEEDSTSLHITAADEAYDLGSINQNSGNPFLNTKLLLDAARSTGADAIHPGYGYLSENPAFADAVREAGLTFIGPSSEAMSILGDKRNSKEYLRKHASKVPLIPGFSGSSQNPEDLEKAAEDIGFPVMLKASAGGGGRGMRIVHEKSKVKDELARATSEAQRSFGSSDCILEKYIEAAKHIEVQIIGDKHGNVRSLWERECSVQRRNQKIIEETPSPFLNDDQRKAMCDAAVELGQLIGYEGAGTVEFVVDAKTGHFFFLEVNTRLQVEHPITEEVTGYDVVSLQLFVAAGGRLDDILPSTIPQNGHAIECRLCAEDPGNDFMPEQGTIRLWKPAEGTLGTTDVRYEAAVKSSSVISIYFDSMIAKIVVWAPTRSIAIQKMAKTLAGTACAGVRTNQEFLQACLMHSSFQDPAYTTSLIPTNLSSLLKNPYAENLALSRSQLSVVAGAFLRHRQTSNPRRPFRSIRRGFRNHTYDSTNVNAILITTVDPNAKSTPMLFVANEATKPNQDDALNFSLISLAELETEVESEQKDKSAAYLLSTRYNVISDKLRGNVSADAPQYRVKPTKLQEITSSSQVRNAWGSFDAEFFVNEFKVRVYIATNANADKPDSSGSPTTVICHFPDVGTWIEYRCYTVLGYFESLRQVVDDASGTGSKSVKAPMPCKVLSVMKKNGDEVKAGETVMVIESMKMETNVTIGVAGTFQTNVKEGDAVDDGKILCWVE